MNKDYEYVIKQAENGDANALYGLADLYGREVFGRVVDEDIECLERFFECSSVIDILDDIDTANDTVTLVEEIIDAGLRLGYYYMCSSNLSDLMKARKYFCNAASFCKDEELEACIKMIRDIDKRIDDVKS